MREKVWLVATVCIGAAATQFNLIYYASYHAFTETLYQSVLEALFFSLGIAGPVWLVAATLTNPVPTRFIAAITGLFIAYRTYTSLNPSFVLSSEAKILAMVVLIALALILIRFLETTFWMRLARLTVFASCAWIISVPVISISQAYISINASPERTLSVEHLFNFPPKAVVFLVLDELSPEAIRPIAKAVESTGVTIHQTKSVKAGINTINAIPSMLTPRRHDDVTICGATQLCGPAPFLMKRMEVNQPTTDVIGFYHPYCSIKGLRYCKREGVGNVDQLEVWKRALIKAAARLPLVNRLMPLTQDHVVTIYDHTRQQIEIHAFNAPFWGEGGGLLYIHQILPHPIGTGKHRKLSDEYKANIERAALFVADLNTRLRHRFNDDYAFVITSDHPLRTFSWCKYDVYASDNCLSENPKEGGLVPFIVATPKAIAVNLPSTNVGVLSPKTAN